MSLYNKMRPSRLSEVRGQDNVVKILADNLSPGGHLPNAMLFIGTRGTGKTTVAKIVAKQLNCESPLEDGSCCNACAACKAIKDGTYLDVLELDAASNNGVDNVRDIIEKVQYKPIGKKKVIILDEVHMLSKAAFNALLKIMEEPPADVLFILCTTELHEIPATILSRCRKFTFNTISPEIIIEKLHVINQMYGLRADEGALELVARAAKGSMRDAESIYESFLDTEGGYISEEIVMETLGCTNDDIVFSILDGISKGDPTISFAAIQQAINVGGSLSRLVEECFRVLMDVVTIHMGADISGFSSNSEYLGKVSELAFSFDTERLFEIADSFKAAYEKKTSNLELVLQSTIIGLMCRHGVVSSLENRVAELERELNSLKQAVSSGQLICSSREMATYDEEEPVRSAAQPLPDAETVLENVVTLTDVPCSGTFSDDMVSELSECGFAVLDGDSPFPSENAEKVNTEFSENISESETQSVNMEGIAEDYFGEFARLFDFGN